ncbi:nucleic acid dioxygenase ALKBH1 isoform X1 [Drosophila tropicalis]|uniref:nucleic acid dioxygenase ALKBH1 isoform X1 n=1 Tax=Drosophila tropicalis TaxID=46794 RepID=UPI0035ABDF43
MFKSSFKHYKTRSVEPDLSEVIDFDNCDKNIGDALQSRLELPVTIGDSTISPPPFLQPLTKWRCYDLAKHSGLMVIRNPFTNLGQRYWIARCLRDYPCAPNIVNLNEDLFLPAARANWWSELQSCPDTQRAHRLKVAMRWTTLGYHHNWNTKVYDEEMHSPFPQDLSKMCEFFATVLGHSNYASQAAIVNYYPIGSTLSGHTDHSEPNQTAPLFSFSFGQSCIFLIGGRTLDEKPTALYLRSGDVLIMSNESRLCYHAVPRVMKASEEPWSSIDDNTDDLANHSDNLALDIDLYRRVNDKDFWLPFGNYVKDSRINMNVRQVL